jgi:hypothetical protein
MLDPWTASRLHQSAPEARLLVLLRDPMARMNSALRHSVEKYGWLSPRVIALAIERSCYVDQLDRVLRWFPRDQVLVLQFEKCVQEPEAELARTFQFLGVDPGFVPKDLRRPVNETRVTAVTVASDIQDLARELFVADRERIRSDWPELDIDLWPGLR